MAWSPHTTQFLGLSSQPAMASGAEVAVTGPWVCEGSAVSSGPPATLSSPLRGASSQTCPGLDACIIAALSFLVSGRPRLSYPLRLGSMSPAGCTLWSGMPLPKPLVYPCFPLGLSCCPCLGIVALGTWKTRDLSCVWPPVRRDYQGVHRLWTWSEGLWEVFPSCPWCGLLAHGEGP